MARGADDVADGNPTVCRAGSGRQMRVTEYEDDHEKEISQSDGETMKEVITNEASTLSEHRYQLEGTTRGIRPGENKYRVTRPDDERQSD